MPDNLVRQPIEEPKRKEKIKGQIYLMSPAGSNHNIVAANIWRLFDQYLIGKKCRVLADNYTLYLSDDDYFVPDLMVVCNSSIIYTDGVDGTPDLVVEVLSPSTEFKDRGDKKDSYETLGVREYWLADPERKSIEQYLLQDGKFRLAGFYRLYSETEIAGLLDEDKEHAAKYFKTSLFDDFDIPMDQIFQDMVTGLSPRKRH